MIILSALVVNIFCKTGRGGGIDPGCKHGNIPGPKANPATAKSFAATKAQKQMREDEAKVAQAAKTALEQASKPKPVEKPKERAKMLTETEARTIFTKFKEMGGFSKVDYNEFGYNTGRFQVELWNVNPKSGNRNLHQVDHVPANEKEYKLIRKIALGKANEADQTAYNRMITERQVNQS